MDAPPQTQPISPRVAVIVPCFNAGATLPAAIASIRSCTIPFELVVVDDGSTEELTRAVLADLESQGLEILRQENLGPSAATNAGIAATTAPYVMRFDADDLLESGALEALSDALDQAPAAGAAWGDFQTFGSTSFVVPGVPALDPWLVTHVNLTPGSGSLIRRTALDAAGGWRLRDGYEDWDLWMGLAESGTRAVYVPRVIFRYRRSNSGRQATAQPLAAAYYTDLLNSHQQLLRDRRQNLIRSSVPLALKAFVLLIDAVPGLPRLTKITACEFFARLLWCRRPADLAQMFVQGIMLRARATPRLRR